MLLDDRPSYPAAAMGAIRAGFVPVLLNTQATPELLRFFLADSGARVAVCEPALADRFEGAAGVETLVVAGDAAPEDAGGRTVSERAFLQGRPEVLPCADTGPDDMAFWMYSSGSTGRPKGIVHLQHDMAYTAMSYGAHVLRLGPPTAASACPRCSSPTASATP